MNTALIAIPIIIGLILLVCATILAAGLGDAKGVWLGAFLSFFGAFPVGAPATIVIVLSAITIASAGFFAKHLALASILAAIAFALTGTIAFDEGDLGHGLMFSGTFVLLLFAVNIGMSSSTQKTV